MVAFETCVLFLVLTIVSVVSMQIVSRRSKIDRSAKADFCKSSDGGRHTDRHIEMKDDDDADGFDGVPGGSGICSVDIVGSEVDEICRIGIDRSTGELDKLQLGSEESCDVGSSDVWEKSQEHMGRIGGQVA